MARSAKGIVASMLGYTHTGAGVNMEKRHTKTPLVISTATLYLRRSVSKDFVQDPSEQEFRALWNKQN